jgi:hypothetical protein
VAILRTATPGSSALLRPALRDHPGLVIRYPIIFVEIQAKLEWVNNTTHHVDPVLVKDVNTCVTDSQRGSISSDSPDVTKIFDDCHSIGQ